MELKELVGKKILDDVIKYKDPTIIYPVSGKQRIQWKVLVVDHFSMRVISSCCKVHDLCEEGVTLIENIHKERQSIPSMDAIYLLTPIVESVQALLQDFQNINNPKYRSAFVFFTEEIPDDIFEMLKSFPVKRYMKACQEIDISFLPHEKQVFSLDSRDTFKTIYSPDFSPSRPSCLERLAEQIATLCVSLDEFPSIRYRKEDSNNYELAQLVEKKLNSYKENNPTMGESPGKGCSQLLILDRGFDCISPLLHELTLQAMAYDLLPIENDVYSYQSNNITKEVLLDENDDMWVDLRYKHIAIVSNEVTKQLKQFIESKKILKSTNAKSIKDLSQMIKQVPQYQKEISKYGKHLNLVEDCVKAYEGKIDKLCSVEQDLVMGYDGDGEMIKDHFKNIVPIFLDESVSKYDKVRLIALYVMIKNGISKENLRKLLSHAQLEDGEQKIIENLQHLGVNVFENNGKINNEYPRRERNIEEKYRLSRWTPILKDILEDCLEDKLDESKFPFIQKRPNFDNKTFRAAGVTSARQYGNWRDVKNTKNNSTNVKDCPRIICFIVGGITMSETRTAYELKDNPQRHYITVGSSQILTPEEFLTNLHSLT